MGIDDRESRSTRPQTITRDMAGKWIAWSEDGLRIVAVGDSFDDCERKAVKAGYSPNLLGIMGVPEGRPAWDGAYITKKRWLVRRVLRRSLLVGVILIGLTAAFFAGFILGQIGGEFRDRQSRFSREEPVMSSRL